MFGKRASDSGLSVKCSVLELRPFGRGDISARHDIGRMEILHKNLRGRERGMFSGKGVIITTVLLP